MLTPPPSPTLQSSTSSSPPRGDDGRLYVFIHGKQFKVPRAYPKGVDGGLVNDQKFIDDLYKYLVMDFRNACAWNNIPRAKLESSDMKSDWIYKRVFADFL